MTGENGPLITAEPLVVPQIVALPVQVDLTNALDVGTALMAAFGPRVAVVIADMTSTEFCDGSGIRYLMVANEVAAEAGAELRLVITSEAVLLAIRVMGADRNLRIYGSMSDALSNAPRSPRQELQVQPSGSPAVQPGAEMTG